MKKKYLILIFAIFFSIPIYADETLIQLKQTLERVNRDIIDLQKEVFAGKNKSTLKVVKNDSSQITVFDMRIRDIENELKKINLNYENLSFEIDELMDTVKELTVKLNDTIINKNNNDEIVVDDSSEKELIIIEEVKEKNTLGSLKINSEDLSDSETNTNDVNQDILKKPLLPEEQFQLAFDLLRSQQFDEARLALEKFIKDNPENQISGSAHYWLGEIYLLKKENREAALIFAEGYQKYPKSIKAPDSLYKLADALIKIEKKNEACDTLNQFIMKYPQHQLNEKTKSKIIEIKCK